MRTVAERGRIKARRRRAQTTQQRIHQPSLPNALTHLSSQLETHLHDRHAIQGLHARRARAPHPLRAQCVGSDDDSLVRRDVRQRVDEPRGRRVLGRRERAAHQGLQHVRLAAALPEHRRRGGGRGLELGAVRDVLAADVQREEHQRARGRPRRVRLQHRVGRDEHAHGRPGQVARQDQRVGEAGVCFVVRSVRLVPPQNWLDVSRRVLG